MGVAHLGDAAEAAVDPQMLQERPKPRAGAADAGGVAIVDPQVRVDERPDQPRPDHAVVHRRAALVVGAGVAGDVPRVVGRQRPQPVRREQGTADDVDRVVLLGRRQRRVRQRDGENLVGPQALVAVVVARPARDAVGEAPAVGQHERLAKRLRHARLAEQAQGVVPQGVDLDGLARPRRGGLAGDVALHPRQPLAIARQEPVGRVDADAEARARAIPLDNRLARRPQQAVEGVLVARDAQVAVGRLDEPKAGVDGLVVGLVRELVEAIGNHPAVDVHRERAEHLPGRLVAAGGEQQARQRDEGVAAPVAREWVAGEDRRARLAVGPAALDDEVGRRPHEQPLADGGHWRQAHLMAAAIALVLQIERDVVLVAEPGPQREVALGLAGRQLEGEGAGRVEILAIRQAAGGLHRVGLRVPPVGRGLERQRLGRVGRRRLLPGVQGQVAVADAAPAGAARQLEAHVAGAPQLVEVAQRRQRRHLQADRLVAVGLAPHAIPHGGGVATPADEQVFKDLRPADVELPRGRVVVQAEASQRRRPLALEVAAEVAAPQLVPLAADRQHAGPPAQGDHAADRRVRGGDEARVVAARVDIGHGAAGEAAQAVGQQPLAADEGGEFAVGFLRQGRVGFAGEGGDIGEHGQRSSPVG